VEGLIWAALGLYLAGLAAVLVAAWRRSGLPLAQAVRVALQMPPVEAGLARLLAPVVRDSTVVTVVLVLVVALAQPAASRQWLLVVGVWWASVCAGLLVLIARGRARLAAWFYPLGMFVIVTLALAVTEGFHGVGASAYVLVILSAGLFLGWRGAAVFAALTSLLLLLISAGEAGHLLAARGPAPR
jgi:hypothetical protein